MPGSRLTLSAVNLLLVLSLLTTLYPLQLFTPPAAAAPPAAPELLPSAAAASSAFAPQTPLAISRAQSSFQAGETIVISYTVTNLLPPAQLPDVPPGATITDTLAILDDYDVDADPNTLHNVLITNELAPAAPLQADNSDGEYRWSLGSLPPRQSKTITMTVNAPPTAATFVELDGGAQAFAAHNGRRVTASSPPAVIAPDGFGQWLIPTIDANFNDEYLQAQAAELSADPAELFAYVQGLDFEPYDGSLRGTRGTIWSAAGNSVDQASLLIALLRANGIPARYRHGQLSPAAAQTVLATMFPAPTQYIGVVDSSLELSDPLNDPELITLAQDHWWVEAYLPGGGWTDLDPVFPGATIGATYISTIATDGSDQIAELPDSLRHKVDLSLRVEAYNPLFGGSGLKTSVPLSATLRTVELVGEPLTFSHLTDRTASAGLIFNSSETTYTPYFLVGDEPLFGETYQDLFTSFPLATVFHTGAWLNITTTKPGGESTTFERELADKIGYALRNGVAAGSAELASNQDPLLSDLDLFTTHFLPNAVPAEVLADRRADALAAVAQINADARRLEEQFGGAQAGILSPAERAEYNDLRGRFQVNLATFLDNQGISFAEAADRLAAQMSEGLFIKAYFDTPRIVTVSSQIVDDQTSLGIDLRQTGMKTIAAPGQPEMVAFGFNISRGFLESDIEGQVLEQSLGEPVLTTSRIFQEMTAQNIDVVHVTEQNLYALDLVDISDEARTRITQAIVGGHLVAMPAARVTVDGEQVFGWWEIDVDTGATVGVLENGTYGAFEYLAMQSVGAAADIIVDFIMGVTAYTLGFVRANVLKAINGPEAWTPEMQALYKDIVGKASQVAACSALLGGISPYAYASCTGVIDVFGMGWDAGEQLLSHIADSDPPVPSVQMAFPVEEVNQSTATGSVTVPATLGSGPLTANLTADFLQISGDLSLTAVTSGTTTYAPDFLTATGDLLDENGGPLGSGPYVATPAAGDPFSLLSSPASAELNGSGRLAFYAGDFTRLAAGADWESYSARVSGAYSLTLANAAVTNGVLQESGTFTLDTIYPAEISGSGPTPAANFAPSASLVITDALLTVGPAAGTLTLGGAPLDPASGLAAAGFSGSLDVSKGSPAGDSFLFSGAATVFTLATNPVTSTTTPNTPANFDVVIDGSAADTYTVTVSAPDGWNVSLDPSGTVSARPPAGAPAGSYTIAVSARSQTFPALALSTAHQVTVQPFDDFLLDVAPDLLFTVPMGPEVDIPGANSTNTGQAQVLGAAYTIFITNTANADRSYTVDVSGLPSGWTLLGKDSGSTTTSLALPAGAEGRIGLYIQPGFLPAAGGSYPFDVQVTSNSSQIKNENETFVMPAVPFNKVEIEPQFIAAAPNSSETFTLTVTNVGNAAGSFPVTATTYLTPVVPGAVTSPVALNAGDANSQQVSLNIGDAPPGSYYFVDARSSVPGTPYEQIGTLTLFVMTADGLALQGLADRLLSCTGDETLASGVAGIGLSLSVLEAACSGLECNSLQRDAVVNGAAGLVDLIGLDYSPVDPAAVTNASQALAGSSTPASILAALPPLTASIEALEGPLCELAGSRPAAAFSPTYSAALTGGSQTVTLTVSNLGTLTTTYDVTTTLPSGVDVQQVTIDPGDSAQIPFLLNGPTAELALLDTVVRPQGAATPIEATASAAVNFVDQFIQTLTVRPQPNFVESGTSASTIFVDVANIAGLPLESTAQLTLFGPGGGVTDSAAVPLTLRPGSFQSYELHTFDTSGLLEGVYTVTVSFEEPAGGPLIPDGSGFGFLGVGQALGATHTVQPELVSPGDVTVTTTITTEILLETVVPTGSTAAPLWEPTGLRENSQLAVVDGQLAMEEEETSAPAEVILASTSPLTDDLSLTIPNSQSTIHNSPPLAPLAPTGYTRTESLDASVTYTGSWNTSNLTPASGGTVQRSTATGSTASFSFTGTWVNVGFVTTDDSGAVELFLDGASQGIFDLYSNENGNLDVIFSGLSNTNHTISLTTLSAVNPNAINDRVHLDFFDTWDGTPIPNGTLEQDSADFLYSNNWNTTVNNAAASGGTYARSGNGTAWLPFDGDSISIDVFKFNIAGPADFFVDGQFLARVDLYSVDPVTETISFTGFGPGLHLLTVRQHQDQVTIDRVTTPAISPAYAPPVQTGIIRIEEFDPAIRYDGQPFTATSSIWRYDVEGKASRSETAYSGSTAGATVSYDFSGDWVSVGLIGTTLGGQVEVAIDGLPQETIDTYRRATEPIGRVYSGLGPGPHTITLTVLPTSNPLSGQNRLYFDYFETWDGTNEPSGTFEADLLDLDRLRYSGSWSTVNDINAANGSYARSTTGSLWFHFTGDSVTYEAFAHNGGDLAQVWLDGSYVTTIDLESPVDVTRTLTLDGLGAGPHVLLVRAARGQATADRFFAPAVEPATDLTCGPYCRYEDEHPDLRYNGFPLNQAAGTFFSTANARASRGYVLESRTAGDTVGLTFDGAAVAVGLHAYERGGLVDITIDGALVETVDTYSPDPTNLTRFYPLPVSGSHTISVTLTGAQNPFALNARLQLDFIDVWDGTALPGGTREIESAAYFNANWGELSDPAASGATYRRSQPPVSFNHQIGTVWIPFEGDSVQFDAIARGFDDPYARVFVDGVEQPSINLWNGDNEVRTFAFDGFGSGAHLLQITGERAIIALDTVTTPATQPAHTNPTPAGLIRYEENAFTYDGFSWDKRATGWIRETDPDNSILVNGYSSYEAVRSNQAGRSASLTFDGIWANLGLLQYSSGGTAEIYLDGVLTRTISLNGPETITETQFALTPGSHTISVSVVGDGQVVLDFLDVYDGTPVSDGLIDAWLGDPQANTRMHYSNNFDGTANPDAIGDRYMTGGAAVWYTFVGDSFTFYGFGTNNNSVLDLFVDNQLVDTIDLRYTFTNSPLAFHYSGLGDGPHSVRIEKGGSIRADAFASPATNTPVLPTVEWFGPEARGAGFSFCGICSGFTAGDINGDGIVELVFGSHTFAGHQLFVYRGDGGDTGDGDAVVWSDAYGSGDIGTPALGELDPAYPGTEIVVPSNNSLRVYHADGTLWWEDPSITMYDYIGAVTLGNLDADPEPEIVVNAREELIVLDADGTELWSVTKATRTGIPLLADMTGDGILDIIVSESGKATFPTLPSYVYLYDFNLGTPNLVWTHTLTTTQVGLFGSMAVADVDGQQPGGDPEPEIAASSDGYLTIINHDGSLLWTTPLEPGAPGGVSVADIDGDGEIEIITGMRHEFEPGRFGKLYAVNADGSLLWDVPAEDSTSANSAAVLDLNGDGIFEIAWNGLEQGFNIFNGLDGSVLFNDPTINTRSGTDYPIIVDVDGDDSAEIVIATQLDGVVVLGFDGLWGEARPVWNQHTYHITNVNDDLTIPDNELDSWAIHNTYKTQFPGEVVLPIFGVNISHTIGSDGQSAAGFSVPPDLSADPTYGWDYVQNVSNPVITRTLDLALTGLAPGETRLVAEGTTISYTLGSGQNTLSLPPLFVTAGRLIAIEPYSQTVGAGGSATYTLTLSNPGSGGATYNLALAGWPAGSDLPASVNVPANSSVAVPLTLTTTEQLDGTFDFVVTADSGSAADSAAGQLLVADALDLSLAPERQTAAPGQGIPYTLTVTNKLPTPQTISLTAAGAPQVTLPASVLVGGNDSTTVVVTATGTTSGQALFTVAGTLPDGSRETAPALLDVTGTLAVGLDLAPEPAFGGPGMPAVITVTVTNLGVQADTFDLAVEPPAGWQAELALETVSLPSQILNSLDVRLDLTPPAGTPAGSYPYTVTAASQNGPASITAVGNVAVGTEGVQIGIDPTSRTLSPTDSPSWNLTVTNTGSVQTSYVLTMTGIVALDGQFSQPSVTLNPGQAATVQLNAGDLSFALPGETPFSVAAVSQANPLVRDQVEATMTFTGREELLFEVQPAAQTITDTFTAEYVLVITNTGSLPTVYDFSVTSPDLAGRLGIASLNIPPRQTAVIPLTVEAAGDGTFTFDGAALSGLGTTASDGGLLTVSCTAPAVPDVSVVVDGDTVRLSWPGGDAYYEVYRSASAYSGYTLLGTTATNSFLDTNPPGGVGDTAINYSYEVRALNLCAAPSGPSGRVGEFDYPLTVGD